MTKEITADAIQKWCDDLVVKMADKGVVMPEAYASITSDRTVPSIILGKKGRYDNISEGYFHAKGYTLAERMADCEAHVAELPSPEVARLNEFLRLVAAAADYGNANGIPSDFINPLTEAAQRLSKNALEDQR